LLLEMTSESLQLRDLMFETQGIVQTRVALKQSGTVQEAVDARRTRMS